VQNYIASLSRRGRAFKEEKEKKEKAFRRTVKVEQPVPRGDPFNPTKEKKGGGTIDGVREKCGGTGKVLFLQKVRKGYLNLQNSINDYLVKGRGKKFLSLGEIREGPFKGGTTAKHEIDL